jgi:prepilin-type processing-associated H-X9-DG protein
MDQVYVVRHKVLVEGKSYRRTAREMKISRNTVKRYVEGAEPAVRKAVKRERPVLDEVGPRIVELLEDSKDWTAGKQKLTAARLHELLVGEGLEVGYTLVKEVVAEWKRKKREAFIPLVYAPGELAQVDFFEVFVDVADQRGKAWMFVMRLMHSGRDFAWLYPRQAQVCFLDGHVRAFEHFGFVPQRIAYDNLKAAVKKLLVGSERELSARFAALITHYVFEPSFCRPRTGHDKGGVESRGKAIRWQHLVPIPKGPTLPAIAHELLGRLDREAQSKTTDGQTIAERFDAEKPRMLRLPTHRFRASSYSQPTVSRRALVCVETAYYSVPCHWKQLAISAYAGVDTIELVGPDDTVVHDRVGRGQKQVDYRHYLPELARKPQALRQVAAPLIAQLGEPFAASWRRLVDIHGPKEAARHFAKVCEAIVRDGEQVVARALVRALRSNEPLTLFLEPQPTPEGEIAPSALPSRLASVEIEAGSAADYDELLGGDQ